MIHLIDRSGNVEPTWVEGESSEIYHGNKTAVGSSSLRKILKSPATFYSHYVDGFQEPDSSRNLYLGSAFHMALLEPKRFFSKFIKMPAFSGKTKEGKESAASGEAKSAKQEWLDAQPKDAVILSIKEYLNLEGMINSVLNHRSACALLKNGLAEVSGYYSDPVTGIKCKIKPDFLNEEMMCLVDVKTTQDCEQDAFMRHIWSYRYDFQLAHYATGIELIMGRPISYAIFLAVEKTPPFECALWIADETMLKKGREDYRIALDKLNECLKTNKWPAYQGNIQTISLPMWVVKQLGEVQ